MRPVGKVNRNLRKKEKEFEEKKKKPPQNNLEELHVTSGGLNTFTGRSLS